jgi:DegV family protein with EDD domain
MKVVTDVEYIDDAGLNVADMVEALKNFKGKSGSSCPNVGEWLEAFGNAENVFGVTITKNLSGSYNAACQAAEEYMQIFPSRKAFIFDSLSAGPELAMIIDKIKELVQQGLDFHAIVEKVLSYHNHLHTLFCLQSLTNLARNGRTSPAVAKIAGVLGIQITGDVKGGTITPVHKVRGEKKALASIVEMMKEKGIFDGAKVRIAHCYALEKAQALVELVRSHFPNCDFHIEPCGGLCSFYAEAGGLMIGFEGTAPKI